MELTLDRAREIIKSARLNENQRAIIRDINSGSCDMRVKALRETLGTNWFDAITLDASHNSVMKGYGEVPDDWKPLTNIKSIPTMKAQNASILSGFAPPPVVPQNGMYGEAPMSDDKVTYTPVKYGDIMRISMESMINDEMGALQERLVKKGRSYKELLNEFVIGNLLDGSTTMDYDSVVMFHATDPTAQPHANLTASGGGISLANVEVAIKLLMNQIGLGKNKIYLMPKYIVCSPAIYMQAAEILSSTTKVGGSTTVAADNAISRLGIQLIVSPHVDSVATTWYLAAGPFCELGFYQGKTDPETFMEPENAGGSFLTDSNAVKTRLIFGGDATDHRWVVKMVV